ncbi:MAG: hypothetical protein KGY54_09380 [Oleiphilaceae bacterium]|nr:hypothetical protein [Oleiphilaceae bacterium]
MALPISQLPMEVMREVRAHKWLALLLFIIVSFGVLGAGFFWPYKYESQVIVFVDDSNIIGPLMEGSAVTTKVTERASVAKETLWHRDVMSKLATDTSVFGEGAEQLSDDALESRIRKLRGNMDVRPRGKNYFTISFSSESQLEAFRGAQRLGQLFISESSERKRTESRGAYGFIDRQVKSYEEQLRDVEKSLQEFLTENSEGTEGVASSRMANLQNQLEVAQLKKQELMARANSLAEQLQGVNPNLRAGQSQDAYVERIRSMEEQLDDLRLRYHDTYPDIVILREQLAELRNQQQAALASAPTQESSEPENYSNAVNPLYQELRATLVTTRADINTTNSRIDSLQGLIAEQSEKMDRIQGNKREYSELTRDMEVNTEIYNDLLKRRERARVSMRLDIEGQGLNYRISENAQYPRLPSGPQFPMFAAAGLLLGLAAPFGALAGMLQVDPRIRARQQLEETAGFPVLMELPRVRTALEKRRERRVTMVVIFFTFAAAALYLAIAAAGLFGVI